MYHIPVCHTTKSQLIRFESGLITKQGLYSVNHKTEIENYFAPYTRRTVTYPDNNYVLTFHEQIPIGTIPGDYILKVIQLKSQGDNEGIEIFSKTFFVK